MYDVTVAGQMVLGGKTAEIEYYEETFTVSEGEADKARVLIQRSGILEQRLQKKKNFKRWQTCQVIDIQENKDAKQKDTEKEIDELVLKASSLGCLPVEYKSLGSDKIKIMKLKEAIERHEDRVEKAKAKKAGELMEGYV